MCGGWGELLEIDQLPRNDFPAGSEVPPINLVRQDGPTGYSGYEPGPIADMWGKDDVEPEITDTWNSSNGEPVSVPCKACGGSHNVGADGICQRCKIEAATVMPSVPAVSVPAPTVDKDRAAAALGELLGSFVDMDQIRDDIANAVSTVRDDMRKDTQETVSAGILILEENFKQAVEGIIAPKTYVIENRRVPDAEPKTIIGAHKAFEKCLRWLNARDSEGNAKNLFLIGPAGSGKTTLAKQLADALGVSYFTTGQVLGEHQVTGFVDAGGSYHPTPFQHSFVNGGLWLGDEFDGWSPEAALAMNGALANGHATFPSSVDPQVRHSEWYCVVAGNTWGKGSDREYVGRNQMDAASLSRYVKIFVDYDRDMETRLAGDKQALLHLVWTLRDRARELKVREVFGTRELLFCVDGMDSGMSQKDVVQDILKRDITDDVWRKLEVTA